MVDGAPASDLTGRVALVTGASGGIGRAVAHRFARFGADLILLGRDSDGLQAVAQEVGPGRTVATLAIDLRDQQLGRKVRGLVQDRIGRLDILVGNGAILGTREPLWRVSADEWSDILRINFVANMELVRALHDQLARSDAGRVIGVTSKGAQVPAPNAGPYCAAKAALEAAMGAYAAECVDTPLRVNVLDPGPTRTKMRAEFLPDEDPQTVPTADKVAALFHHLASPDCSISGQVVRFVEWQQQFMAGRARPE